MTISIRRHWPLLQHKRFARNGQVPDASFLRGVISRQNTIASYRRKCFMSWGDMDNAFAGATGTTNLFRFRCHVGYAATHIGFHIGMATANTSGVDPRIEIAVTLSGGATTTATVRSGLSGTAETLAPDNITWVNEQVAVTANSTYEVLISAIDYGRPVAITAYEIAPSVVDTTIEPFVDSQQGAVGFPVFDSTRQDILEGLSNLWRRNGAHLLTWAGVGDGTGVAVVGTTATNIIDGTTAVAASSAGYYLDGLENLCRISDSTTIDVVLATYASSSSGTGQVRLQDSTGTRASVAVTGVAAWYTSATTIANTNTMDKVDVQVLDTVSGAGTTTVYAVCLYAYLA